MQFTLVVQQQQENGTHNPRNQKNTTVTVRLRKQITNTGINNKKQTVETTNSDRKQTVTSPGKLLEKPHKAPPQFNTPWWLWSQPSAWDEASGVVKDFLYLNAFKTKSRQPSSKTKAHDAQVCLSIHLRSHWEKHQQPFPAASQQRNTARHSRPPNQAPRLFSYKDASCATVRWFSEHSTGRADKRRLEGEKMLALQSTDPPVAVCVSRPLLRHLRLERKGRNTSPRLYPSPPENLQPTTVFNNKSKKLVLFICYQWTK